MKKFNEHERKEPHRNTNYSKKKKTTLTQAISEILKQKLGQNKGDNNNV